MLKSVNWQVLTGISVITVSLALLLMTYYTDTTVQSVIFVPIIFVSGAYCLWRTQQQRRERQKQFAFYAVRLKQTFEPAERQHVLDTMIMLNLLSSSDLSGIDFSEVHLPNVNLAKSNMSITKQIAIDLSGADLRKAKINYSNLSYALLRSVNLVGANLHGSTLDHSDLHKSNLQQANLSAASLQDTDLSETDLRGANLRFANLTNANLLGANLSNAKLNHAILPDGSEWSPQTDMLSFTQIENSQILNPLTFATKESDSIHKR